MFNFFNKSKKTNGIKKLTSKDISKLNNVKRKKHKINFLSGNNLTKSVVVPRKINIQKAKETLESYKSNISNLFTSNDITLSTEGFVRLFDTAGYYGDVIKALTIYDQDGLIGGLIDSVTDNANTNLNFDLPSNNKKEAEIWNTWRKTVNIGTRNVLPGLKNLNSQMINAMLLTGMAIPDFTWGTIKVGRSTYEFPTKITLLPALSVKLRQSISIYGQEDVLMAISKEYEQSLSSDATNDVAYRIRYIEKDPTDDAKSVMRRPNAYAIKFRYNNNRMTSYPNPMLRRSFEFIALRHKYLDADISILEDVINKITQIKVGDENNQPSPTIYDDDGNVVRDGDIEIAQSLFENMENISEVIATPYYYEIQTVIPNTDVLLDSRKYIQATKDIYSNFGILTDPDASSNSVEFEDINLSNYEKFAISIQDHMNGWYTWIASEIIKRNQGRLKTMPSISFDKPDIYDSNFLNKIHELYDDGVIDIYTLHDRFGLDSDKIKERKIIQQQEEESLEGIYDARTTFKQSVESGGTVKEVSNTDEGGKNDREES